MNKELLEKLKAIRESLVAFQAQAQVGDVKKLAELVVEKMPAITSNYNELIPYMNGDQKGTLGWRVPPIHASAILSYERGKDCDLTASVERGVPELLADLDDIEREIQKETRRSNSGQEPSAAT